MDALALALQATGVVSVRANPRLKGQIDAAAKRGELVRLLPGIYGRGTSLEERIGALFAWDPDAVLTGATAAKVGWWPELAVTEVSCMTRINARVAADGFRIGRGKLPDDLISEREGVRLASVEASVIQLLPTVGPGAIDEALRRGVATVDSLRWALAEMPGRAGNALAARLIEDSRDEPWSELERQVHQLLRAEGITGWRANHRVVLPSGPVFIDVAFPALKLALEFDGWQFHRSRERFEGDRSRDVELQLAGWRVFRFTDATLGEVLNVVRAVAKGIV